jgi:hypothetical protein
MKMPKKSQRRPARAGVLAPGGRCVEPRVPAGTVLRERPQPSVQMGYCGRMAERVESLGLATTATKWVWLANRIATRAEVTR